MPTTAYEQAFDNCVGELARLLQQRRQISERISQLRQVVIALDRQVDQDKKRREKSMQLLSELQVFAPRLTDAAKDALYSAGSKRLPAIQVKELMEVRGFDFSNFPNPLASVHSTLRRLAAQSAIGCGADKDMTVYWWRGPDFGARNSLANTLGDREQAKRMDKKIRTRVNRELSKWGIVTLKEND